MNVVSPLHCSYECCVISFSDLGLHEKVNHIKLIFESTQTVLAMLVVWAQPICLEGKPPSGHRKCPTVHKAYTMNECNGLK